MTRYQAIFKKVAPRAGWACAGLLFLGMAVPRQAHAQFGAELAKDLESSDQQRGLAA
jgi:hypothetical protein